MGVFFLLLLEHAQGERGCSGGECGKGLDNSFTVNNNLQYIPVFV